MKRVRDVNIGIHGAARYADVCRGQKRRLHTVCEISYVARSKMTKQLEPGVT